MLNIDLTGITTTRPCPQDGDYVATLTAISVADTDKGKRLDVTFTLANDVLGVPVNGGDAPTIPSGYNIIERYRLYDVENPRAPKYLEMLARLVDGVLGTNDGNRPADFNAALDAMVGKQCLLVVVADNDEKFGWQPRVKKIKPLNA